MKEYMTNLGTVLMLTALSGMVVPEGSIKKYVSLAMGFILITAALPSSTSLIKDVSFDIGSYSLSREDIEKAQAKNRAEVIKMHRENIKNLIEKRIHHNSKVYAEVSENGEIINITLVVKGDESEAVSYIVDTLKVPRERIKIKYDKN